MSTVVPVVLADLIPLPRPISRNRLRDVVLVVGGALFTALAAQIVVHLGFTPVPLTGQTFAVLAVSAVLGSRRAVASQFLYWALGAIGLPFYADAQGGWQKATGATAGYFVGFMLAAWVIGRFADKRETQNFMASLSSMTLGTAIIYVCGTLWLAHSLNIPVANGDTNAIKLGVEPFLVGDAVKMLIAASIAPLGWVAYYSKPQ
jgi:biotin transport system substrate-specific component